MGFINNRIRYLKMYEYIQVPYGISASVPSFSRLPIDLWRGVDGAVELSKTQFLQHAHDEERVQVGGVVNRRRRRGYRFRERARRRWWEEGRNRVAAWDGTTVGWDELPMEGHGFEDSSRGRDGPG